MLVRYEIWLQCLDALLHQFLLGLVFNFHWSLSSTIMIFHLQVLQGQHSRCQQLCPSRPVVLSGVVWEICRQPPGGTLPQGSTLRGMPWGKAWQRQQQPCRKELVQPSCFCFGDPSATDEFSGVHCIRVVHSGVCHGVRHGRGNSGHAGKS